MVGKFRQSKKASIVGPALDWCKQWHWPNNNSRLLTAEKGPILCHIITFGNSHLGNFFWNVRIYFLRARCFSIFRWFFHTLIIHLLILTNFFVFQKSQASSRRMARPWTTEWWVNYNFSSRIIINKSNQFDGSIITRYCGTINRATLSSAVLFFLNKQASFSYEAGL